MTELLQEVGVVGIFAILVIRELLTFFAKRPNGGFSTAGERSVEFWQEQQRRAISDSLAVAVTPLMARMADILSELKVTNVKAVDLLTELRWDHKNQQERTDRLYVKVEKIGEVVQRLHTEGGAE